MTAIAALVAEAIAKASEESVCMFRHDARETYGAPRFLTIADCEPDSVPKDNLCIAEDADSLDDADDRASSANRLNPFSGKPYTYPPRIVYVRRDVFTDALSLLASRAAEAEAEAFDILRVHEASKTVLILKAVEVADAWSGFNESLSSRLHDELGALDLDDVARCVKRQASRSM